MAASIKEIGLLVADIHTGDQTRRNAALAVLKSTLDSKLFETLRSVVDGEDRVARLHAAQILTRAHDERGILSLIRELQEPTRDGEDLLYHKLLHEAFYSGGLHDDRIIVALENKLADLGGCNKARATLCLVCVESERGDAELERLFDALASLPPNVQECLINHAVWLPDTKVGWHQGLLRNLRSLSETLRTETLSNLAILCEKLPSSDEVDVILQSWTLSDDPHLRQNAITSLNVRRAV